MGKTELSLKQQQQQHPENSLLVHLLHDLPGGKAKNRNGFPSGSGQETKVENEGEKKP